jgi:hypothetical protein
LNTLAASTQTSSIEPVQISFGQKWKRTTEFCELVLIHQLWPEE